MSLAARSCYGRGASGLRGTSRFRSARPGGTSRARHRAARARRAWIDCGEATGNVVYTYDGPFECESELTRTSVSGSTSTYADDSQTLGCTDGVVTLLRGSLTGPNAGKLRLTWSYPDGTIDTRGWLTQVASANCPIIP